MSDWRDRAERNFTVPMIPEGFDAQEDWYRLAANARLEGALGDADWSLVRAMFRDLRDAARVLSERDKARAALQTARASARIAAAIDRDEFGDETVQRLRGILDAVNPGRRRRLAVAPSSESA